MITTKPNFQALNEKKELSTITILHAFKSMLYVARKEGVEGEISPKCLELEEMIERESIDFYTDITEMIDNIDSLCDVLTTTNHIHYDEKEKILISIINKYDSLEEFCESLDSCSDLYDLGYIDSEEEQIIYNRLSKEGALRLWAIYMHVKEGSSSASYYLTYEDFLSTI